MSDSNRTSMAYIEEVTAGVTPGARASVVLTMDTIPTAADTITLGTLVYKFVATLVAANDVLIGASLADSKVNLIAAIQKNTRHSGFSYHVDTVENADVFVVTGAAFDSLHKLTIYSKVGGVAGNSVVSTETFTPASNVLSAVTLLGGVDAAFQAIRITGESLKPETSSTRSQELRSDRQTADIIRTGISAAGDINWELSYGAHDEWLEAALFSAGFSAPVTIGPITTVSFAAPNKETGLQVVSDSGSGLVTLLTGGWVKISGATNAVNNGIFRIQSGTAAAAMTIENVNGVVEGAGASITIVQGGSITNGIALRTFTIQKMFEDKTYSGEVYPMCMINQASLEMAPEAIITGSWSILGKRGLIQDFSQASSVVAAATNDVLNAVDHVVGVLDNGLAFDITLMRLNINNNGRTKLIVGTLGAFELGSGTVEVGGQFDMFNADNAKIRKHVDFEETAISFIITDGADQSLVFDMRGAKLTTSDRSAGSINQDIVSSFSFEAKRDSTLDETIKIVRFA